MNYQRLSNLFGTLEALKAILDKPTTSRSPAYVRREDAPFFENRFRIFDEYLITRRPEAFRDFIRLLPNEFEDLYQRIGRRLEHVVAHAGPISGRHRLMIYLRFVTQGMSFAAYALDIGMGKSTVSQVVAGVTEAIISGRQS
ncbi:unnamed protein product [Cylicocyclus nassatus]|uniref:Nuclease HARBI1 n=1 Tax=Cylicocyclus nassatus TaxID=53992 RepID=A0AA36GVP9_CYLNA|nr:unnamed protein product [Cylicocyclus nassatus]